VLFFLRLPDHNPLKRLEAFFRVISRRRRKGLRASSAARDPSVVLFAEMQNTLLVPRATGIAPSRERVLSLARNTTPDEDYAKEDSSIPFSSLLRNYPSPPVSPISLTASLSRSCSPLLRLALRFCPPPPRHGARTKIKIMVPATPAALFYSFDRFFLRAPSARSGDSRHANRATGFLSPLGGETKKREEEGRRERNKARFIVSPVPRPFVKGPLSK